MAHTHFFWAIEVSIMFYREVYISKHDFLLFSLFFESGYLSSNSGLDPGNPWSQTSDYIRDGILELFLIWQNLWVGSKIQCIKLQKSLLRM